MRNIIFKRSMCFAIIMFMLLINSSSNFAFAVDHNNIEPPNPGSLDINKVAEPVSGKSNQWKVTLTMTGKDLPVTSDIVLVIDKSGSMGNGTGRMEAAKNAATNFINTLLISGTTKTRIAVVSFEGAVTVHNSSSPFKGTSEKKQLLDTVKGLSANGGTFTQGAIKKARDLLSTSDATNKSIVLLSDGEPTYGYSMTDDLKYTLRYPDEDDINDYRDGFLFWYTYYRDIYTAYENPTNSSEIDFNYGSTKQGSGSNIREKIGDIANGPQTGTGSSSSNRYIQNYNRLYYNSGNAAISEALISKSNGLNIYTVALSAGDIGTPILNNIASPGKSYDANPTDLNEIFQTIAGRISYAATNAVVTDPIGEKFSVPGINASNYSQKITVTKGTLAWNNATETITWSLDTISEGNPASMSYIVQIDGNIQSGQVYSTNGETYVTYINSRGQDAVKTFPVPKAGVDAGTIQIHYYRTNDSGQPINSAGVFITKEQAEMHSLTYLEGTNLQLNVPYTVAGSSEIILSGIPYRYNSTGNVGDINPTAVTLTPAVPSKHVWFAYSELKDATVTFNENYAGAPVNYFRTTRENTSLGSNKMPSSPVRAGYSFISWSKNSNLTGEIFTESSIVNENITVFARWEQSNYNLKVNYILDGLGKLGDEKNINSTEQSGARIDLTAPEKKGWSLTKLIVKNPSSFAPVIELNSGKTHIKGIMPSSNAEIDAYYTLNINELLSNKMFKGNRAEPVDLGNNAEFYMVKDLNYTFGFELNLKNIDSEIVIKPTGNVTINSSSFKLYDEVGKEIKSAITATLEGSNIKLKISNSVVLPQKYTITYSIKGNVEGAKASIEISEKFNGTDKKMFNPPNIPNPINLNVKNMPDLQ